LSDRFPRLDPSPELDAFERLLADHGAAVTQARAVAAAELDEGARSAFGRIAAPGLTLEVAYQPGGSADAETAVVRLREGRRRDALRKRCDFGPHTDDLALALDGHAARKVASQGQHRAITLALKIAELDAIARARMLLPILLLDDVSSELDADRTEALFRHLGAATSQIILTTTRLELIPGGHISQTGRRDFRALGGAIEPL
jgi:DNA replication and repair protein RecF